MKTTFNKLLEQIKQNIVNNKPGESAHKLMMPQGRIISPPHNSNPIPSAVLIALFEDDDEIYFPIIRRPIYNGHHSGQMGFPGGKFEIADINLINTALRESHEEIGINVKDILVLGTLSNLYIPITNMQILPVVGYLKTKPNFMLDSHEVDALFNINIKDLVAHSNKQYEKWDIRGNEVDVPFYQIQQQKIWGATAMILSEFEQLLVQCQRPYNLT